MNRMLMVLICSLLFGLSWIASHQFWDRNRGLVAMERPVICLPMPDLTIKPLLVPSSPPV